MIRLHNIIKYYRNKSIETCAINELSLSVKPGEFVSIMGPSGCGKTTLLNIIGLLDDFDSGLYLFKGEEVKNLSEKKKLKLRKQNIGFVFQNFNLLEDLTVYENIELPLTYLGLNNRERKAKVMSVLNQVSMSNRKNYYPSQLSGGQQQKVAIGRALAVDPSLILADEPTGNLDSYQGNAIMELLSRLNDTGTTIVMVTHSINDAAYSQKVIKLLDGRIVSEKNVVHA